MKWVPSSALPRCRGGDAQDASPVPGRCCGRCCGHNVSVLQRLSWNSSMVHVLVHEA